ncbi:FecR family protein [Chitinophaga sp. Ak27]|uniref:FecR family protein n=1 Tax=Chitinophaga TaxID=79328 RepID=UPI003977B822
MQGGSLIAQQQAGVLVYQRAGAVTQGETWNTVSTPKGGKYEVVLSDGTHVFLNAASTVKFPVPFNENGREVVLTGEAYFEVSHTPGEKAAWPFVVKIRRAGEDGGEVKVLGTHFNIMAYDDEKFVKTTLVEGSVNMHKDANTVILKPGQQSVWFPQTNTLQVRPADLEAEIAWKNGRFLFRSTDIKTIMRQLSRWYDVTVDYDGDMTDIRFAGNIERKENIKELIEILEADGRLRFHITGNKIIVSRI